MIAILIFLLALAVSSVSADVVIRPPPIPCSVLPMESISLNNVIIDPPSWPDAMGDDGGDTTDGGGKTVTVIINA